MAKLLVVDDQEQNRYLLEVLLKGNGYEVVAAANGAEALELARQDLPDMIITDILMPVMDGFSLCREWKKDPRCSTVPLVFYTATYTDAKDEKFALSLGAERFIIKPTEPDKFLVMLKEVLEEHSSGRLTPSADGVGEEAVFLKEYNESLIHKLEDKLQQLEDANQALKIEVKERSRAQAELARSEKRFSTVFHKSPHGMVITTLEDMVHVDMNEAFCKSTGYTREQLIGTTMGDVGIWLDQRDRENAYRLIRKNGRLDNYLLSYRHHSGQTRQATCSSEIISLDGQDCLISVFIDITEKVRAEQALISSEEKYRTLMEAVADPVVVYDLEDRVVYVNQAFSKIFGWDSEEVLGRPLDFIPPEEAAESASKRDQVLWGGRYSNFETRRKAKDGGLVDVSISAAGHKDDLGRVTGIVVSLQDISARKTAEAEKDKLEAQLRQAQKMEAIGTLAGGIAHDFNNILGVIIGFADLSMLSCEGNPALEANLQKVLEAGMRAKDLVKQILTFSRQTEQEFKPTQVGQVVRELADMLKATIPTSIEMRVSINDDCVVMADPTQLHQVFMNMCTNSVQAFHGQAGALDVTMDRVEIDKESAKLIPDIKPGVYQRIAIADNGSGIPREVLDRIFDPFFTTKKPGEGTGLGLSVAHGIVKNHGGKITAYSEPGLGTTFSIYLPVLENEDERQSSAAATGKLPRGSESILYVDDERLLVDVGTQVLESLGYKLDSYVSSPQALEAFRARPEAYDLVVTDLSMPKLTGLDLAREIAIIRPGTPVILCTGFSENVSRNLARSIGIEKVIMKPIVAKDIAEGIREVLD